VPEPGDCRGEYPYESPIAGSNVQIDLAGGAATGLGNAPVDVIAGVSEIAVERNGVGRPRREQRGRDQKADDSDS